MKQPLPMLPPCLKDTARGLFGGGIGQKEPDILVEDLGWRKGGTYTAHDQSVEFVPTRSSDVH